MKKYAAVIFDWDGTVMDSTHSIVSSIQLACEDLNLPKPSDSMAAWVIGLSLESALYRCVPQVTEQQMPDFLDRYKYHYFRSDHESKPFVGIADSLQQMRANKTLLAVATGKSRYGLDRAMGHANLNAMFDSTRTADETAGKPDPKMLYEILEEFNMQPDQVLMVGDTTHDVDMAHNAGVDSLAVTYGAHDPDTLKKSKPTQIVDTVSDLHAWVMPRLAINLR